MEIRPILSTLRRHKTAAALIILEVALSCAIISNALFLIGNRLDRTQRPSGLAENELVTISISGIGEDDNANALTETDLAALRSIPGVKFASAVSQIPFGQSIWITGLKLTADQDISTIDVNSYNGDAQTLDAMGLKLVQGRRFTESEFSWNSETTADSPSVILTKSAADKMFPGQSALGKSIYIGPTPSKVVGIVERLARVLDYGGDSSYDDSMLSPIKVSYKDGGMYLLRTDPARRQEVLRQAVAVLEKNSSNRIIKSPTTVEEMRNDYYRQDRSMAWLLVTMSIALLIVTALGIVGLASFWVQQRTKQIGIRRALGATRGQILRYFQIENFLLASIGIVLGMLMAYSINLWLMARYELPRLPLIYLPIGAVTLWALGQIAVFWPARRAALVPPAVATRSA
ncbi:ABC transporter permease [Xanthomonas hortorum]|uniref:Macrolide export ATP-binding/permease protein MacB n=1 Tax=Xanthomonas hortorum pv. gardneri TaxID=2754056 RepID=A0A6V7EMG9_9XANT|nr:FtsX-like permease family protein [Xanthomonas hortorum]APP79345.1 ABC transporter permease [Xanthomonas hortorum pv. gardneri]EGD19239.1 ABC-type antimicrobial peptide transport system, permease component [Xanthomonas hortorum ATCC 19865]KLA96905.1 ABC transporter permease [Xanthomonas hortorum pv. gardneri]KLB02736.1 ABC transporter permease [Xanthomonas hortorum pv. gardneri]KLB02848.1 ABC transporter permease [Xanthomonas hortorum pv. gardneri]